MNKMIDSYGQKESYKYTQIDIYWLINTNKVIDLIWFVFFV